MRTMLAASLLSVSVILGACTSQNDEPALSEGTGTLTLDLTTSTAFTKAVDESTYNTPMLYTIQIINASETIEEEFLYSEKPERIELKNGTYTLKAYYGTDSNASRDEFYVEGIETFNVEGKEVAVAVVCQPTCGKVSAKFAEDMDTYFSDYSVSYETEALTAAGTSAAWNKSDSEPWYLKLNPKGETVKATIQVTRISDNKVATIEKTYSMTPGKSWTLNIAPSNDSGNLGITITVDEKTDDETIDITVPSEWI